MQPPGSAFLRESGSRFDPRSVFSLLGLTARGSIRQGCWHRPGPRLAKLNGLRCHGELIAWQLDGPGDAGVRDEPVSRWSWRMRGRSGVALMTGPREVGPLIRDDARRPSGDDAIAIGCFHGVPEHFCVGNGVA